MIVLEPDHIYVNVGVINASNGDTLSQAPRNAQFQESRASPILADASDWNFTIVRFNLDGCGGLLPLWIPSIATGQTNIDLTVYNVTVAKPFFPPILPITAVFASAFPTTQLPQSPFFAQDVTSLYYYGRSYLQFTEMINAAFGALALPETVQLGYDSASGRFYFDLSFEFFAAVPSYVSVNPQLAALLSGFNWTYNVILNPNSQPFYYTLRVPTLLLPPAPGSITRVYADYSSTDNGLWSPVDGFSFITNFIPVVPEQGTAATQVGESNVGVGVNATTNGYANVLTDFNCSGTPESRINAIEYSPLAEYRMGNLSGRSQIQQIDIQVFWRYRLTGQLVPLLLPANASGAVKVLFRKKAWNKSAAHTILPS